MGPITAVHIRFQSIARTIHKIETNTDVFYPLPRLGERIVVMYKNKELFGDVILIEHWHVTGHSISIVVEVK